jgi:hypothetical protein
VKQIGTLLIVAVSAGLSVFAGTTDGNFATPEPATIGLIAVGLGGVGYVAWRRRRR